MPLFVMCIFVLCLFWFALINLGKLVKDRMMMQNAADNAAVSVAVMRARGLNAMGAINAYLGLPGVALGGNVPADISHVIIPCSNHGGLVSICNCQAKKAETMIRGLVRLQEHMNMTYGGGTTQLVAEKVARNQEFDFQGNPSGADGILVDPGAFSLHLNRNMGEIWYWGTMWLNIPFCGPELFLLPPQVKGILVNKKDGKRWLEQRSDFHKQRIKIIAYKNAGSDSNKGYPFAGKLLGLGNKWFDTRAIAAAAAYNTKGAMFPTSGDGNYPAAALIKYFEACTGGWEAHLVPSTPETRH